MGIIRVIASAVGGGLADSYLEVFEANDMGGSTVVTGAVAVRQGRGRGQNTKGEAKTVSNGSIIHVYPNQFMMLLEGGKVIDYTAEEGYYKVENSSLPSLFNGQFEESVRETFDRVRYGGTPSSAQMVVFINLQEIKGIKFGTKNPINYFDNFYNAELFLRTHGTYSIKITDPLLFYFEAVPRNRSRVDIEDINEQYLSEFLTALQTSINQLSAEGERISHVASKSMELSAHMSTVLDESWRAMRGFEISAVGIASISYDAESVKLINMRNQGSMLGDPNVREGYVQGSVARGVEAAGSNPGGATAGILGVGLNMQQSAGFVGAASQANQQQMAQQQSAGGANTWKCPCGAENSGKFCAECGTAQAEVSPPAEGWKCSCGNMNTGKFCSECGNAKPEPWKCGCGEANTGNFCSTCGAKAP